MKAKYHFEIMELDDGLVAVPVGDGAEKFRGVLKINESAKAILKMLEKEITEEEIVNNLIKEYEGEKATITGYVHTFIETLQAEDVLE